MYNKQLDIFICAADCGSFTKASENLYISPTAVMKQINLLENELGLKLFTRTRHGIKLTSAGESIYTDAKFLIEYSKKSVNKAKKLLNSEKYTLRVGTSMLNPCKIFMDLWNKINDNFPEFKISIVPFEDDHEKILSIMNSIESKFDFMVAACDSKQWLKHHNFYKLGQYKICCAVPRNHRLAKKKILKIQDLYGERLMMVEKGDSGVNDKLRAELENNHPKIIIEDTPWFYDIEVFNRCEQNNSVLLTLEGWADIHPSLVTLPVEWDFSLQYGLLYPKNPTENITKFLKAVEIYK